MDLNQLLSEHQIALIKMADACDMPTREWAGVRADYYADRITILREKLEVPVRTFDFRQLAV